MPMEDLLTRQAPHSQEAEQSVLGSMLIDSRCISDVVGVVRHQLLRRSRAAGIAASGLDAAGKGLGGVGVETAHIIALPAVQGQRHGFQLCKRRFGIHTEGGVFFFCFRIAHRSASICIFRLPSAVASMGRAMTRLSVALAVRWLRNSFFAPPPTMYSLSYCFPVFRSSSASAFA